MEVVPVPVLDDNYAYLLIDIDTKTAAAVDPVQPDKLLAAAQNAGVQITKVLTTHKHWDHAGGNKDMLQQLPGIEVVGGRRDQVESCTTFVDDGDEFQFGRYNIKCLHTPGHTLGHICYYVTAGPTDTAVFTGDTLFVGGAGRFFEGTAEDMYPSLYEKLAKLPPDTKVYCGHEYTVANFKFAVTVDPDNEKLLQKCEWAKQQRFAGKPTIPSTIGEELATNPFMRADQPSVQQHTGLGTDATPVEHLAQLREMKNKA